jgi:hypothetical protein
MGILKLVTFAIVLLSVGFLVFQWRTIAGREITTARVTELEPQPDDGTTYYVVATYRDRAGHEHRYRSAWASNPPAHKVGESFRLMYDPGDPARCASLTFGTRFGAAWILLGVGLLILWVVLGWEYGGRLLQAAFPATH